jgi:hypothetical protein
MDAAVVVAVRVRPLSERERATDPQTAWAVTSRQIAPSPALRSAPAVAVAAAAPTYTFGACRTDGAGLRLAADAGGGVTRPCL